MPLESALPMSQGETEARGQPSPWAGLATQARVINALIIRDMMMRYGRNNIGFLWVILEPMILTVGVMILWAAAKAPIEHGVPVVSLVLSGYMPLTLWRHTSNAGINLLRHSISTLYHRHITVLDMVAARMLTELGGVTLAFLVVYGTLLAFGVVQVVYDPGLMILGWLLLWGLGSTFALLLAGLSEYFEAAERFVTPFQYLLIPLSGTFFMVEWLPHGAQELILYNPLVHCYEIFRAGYFGPSLVTHYSVGYPALWILILLFLGLKALASARAQLSGS